MSRRIGKNIRETKKSEKDEPSSALLQSNSSNKNEISLADLDASSILGYQPTVFKKKNADEKRTGPCLTSSPIKPLKTSMMTAPAFCRRTARPIRLDPSDYCAMLYGGYIKAVLMEVQSKQAYERQTKEMHDQLDGLTELNRELLKDLDELQRKELTLEAQCETLNQLELQQESLKGCERWLSETSERSLSLGRALDASMNVLPSSKVSFSNDGRLEALIEETSERLNEIVKVPLVENGGLKKEAEVVESLSRIVTQENEDLLSCVQLVNSSTVFNLTEAFVLTK